MYKTGDILLIPFPFTEHTGLKKVRPSVVVCETADGYNDIVVCAISSVVPPVLSRNDIELQMSPQNNLRKTSILKVDRIVTIKANDVIKQLGVLDADDLSLFITKFKDLV